jgi:putative hydrolase of the HAD superfamily
MPEMRAQIDAVLFDFGGVFTASPFEAADALDGDGAQVSLRELVFGPYDRDTDHPWHRLERGELSFAEARERIIELGEREGVDADPLRLFQRMGSSGSGARDEFVARARAVRAAGYRTALVTNNAREFKRAWRRLVPVEELFGIVVDSSEVGVRKPDPAIFRIALERLEVAPERALFLDDHEGNVRAAARLGIRSIRVDPDGREALAALDALL